jgi:hypothetical protein
MSRDFFVFFCKYFSEISLLAAEAKPATDNGGEFYYNA